MKNMIVLCAFCLAAVASVAQEKMTFNSAVFVDPGAAEFRVASLYLNVQGSEIRAILAEVDPGTFNFKTNGKTLQCSYAGSQADSLLITLNRMNFSTVSLQKRVLQQCQADGKLGAGSVTGTPQ